MAKAELGVLVGLGAPLLPLPLAPEGADAPLEPLEPGAGAEPEGLEDAPEEGEDPEAEDEPEDPDAEGAGVETAPLLLPLTTHHNINEQHVSLTTRDYTYKMHTVRPGGQERW